MNIGLEHFHCQYERLEKLLEWDFPILLLGESGIGKTFMVYQYAEKNNLALYSEAHKDDFILGATEKQEISEKAKSFLEAGGIYLIDEIDKISEKKAIALIDFIDSLENQEVRLKGDVTIKTGPIKVVTTANEKEGINPAILGRLMAQVKVIDDEDLKMSLLPSFEQKDFLKAYQSVFGKISVRAVAKKIARINPNWPEEILETYLESVFPEIKENERKFQGSKSFYGKMFETIFEKEFKDKVQDVKTFCSVWFVDQWDEESGCFDVELEIDDDVQAQRYERKLKKIFKSGIPNLRKYKEIFRYELYYDKEYSISTDTVYGNLNTFKFKKIRNSQKIIFCCGESQNIEYDLNLDNSDYAVVIDLKNKTYTSLFIDNENIPKIIIEELLEYNNWQEICWEDVEVKIRQYSKNEIAEMIKQGKATVNVKKLDRYACLAMFRYKEAPYLSFSNTGFLEHNKYFALLGIKDMYM